MDTIETTAAAIVAGDLIHRVKQAPRSRVFEDAIGLQVVSVERTVHSGVEYVTIHLDGPYNQTLNLDPERVVWVRKDV